jgi:hypothetical protein
MRKNNKLSLILALGLPFIQACGRDPYLTNQKLGHIDYSFEGQLKGEYVNFKSYHQKEILEVQKNNGTWIKFESGNIPSEPLEISSVIFGTKYDAKKYESISKDPVSRRIIEEAQKQFDTYLIKIWEHKYERNLEHTLGTIKR